MLYVITVIDSMLWKKQNAKINEMHAFVVMGKKQFTIESQVLKRLKDNISISLQFDLKGTKFIGILNKHIEIFGFAKENYYNEFQTEIQ